MAIQQSIAQLGSLPFPIFVLLLIAVFVRKEAR